MAARVSKHDGQGGAYGIVVRVRRVGQRDVLVKRRGERATQSDRTQEHGGSELQHAAVASERARQTDELAIGKVACSIP